MSDLRPINFIQEEYAMAYCDKYPQIFGIGRGTDETGKEVLEVCMYDMSVVSELPDFFMGYDVKFILV